MACKKSTRYISKKVLSSKKPVTSGVKSSEARDSAIFLQDWHEMGVLPPGGETLQVLAKCKNDSYYVDWYDADTLIPAPTPTPIIVANTLFVMENGSDVTGTRERFDLPYASIPAAMTASQVGDTVVVYAGTYTIDGSDINNYLLLLGRALYCYSGVSVEVENPHSTFIQPSLYASQIDTGAGIYGNGKFSFTHTGAPGTDNIEITNAGAETCLTIEAESLTFSGVEILIGDGVREFNMNVARVASDVRSITLSDTIGTTCTINIEIGRLFSSAIDGLTIDVRSYQLSNISITINTLKIEDGLNFGNSVIYLSGNATTSSITIHVANYRQESESQIYFPIILNDSCVAYKDISLRNMTSNSLLYAPASDPADIELGVYEFKGVVNILSELNGIVMDNDSMSLIDFRTSKQSVTFALDLKVNIDDSAFVQYNPIVLNISKDTVPSDACNQNVTGRLIVTGVSTLTNKAAIQYGLMDNGLGVANSTPVLDKLIIITDPNQPCLGNNIAPIGSSVPIMNVFANRPVATGTETPLQVIEVVVDDVNVK